MHFANCVLVTLNISNWDANRQDKRVSEAVADANQVTDRRLCRLRKSLLPKTEVMDRLVAVIRAARSFHYENTHAWMHDGPRILPRANFDPYMKQLRRYQADFETAVLDFISQYNDIKGEARHVLGQLYNASDYPDVGQLQAKYGFGVTVQPMPASESLLELGLDDNEAFELRSRLEADMAETFQKANKRLYDDLNERLGKLVAKLGDEKAYVMPETIDAVRKLAELMPRMNVTGDARLDSLASSLTSSLEGVTTESVKIHPDLRERAAQATKTALYALQSFTPQAQNNDISRQMSV